MMKNFYKKALIFSFIFLLAMPSFAKTSNILTKLKQMAANTSYSTQINKKVDEIAERCASKGLSYNRSQIETFLRQGGRATLICSEKIKTSKEFLSDLNTCWPCKIMEAFLFAINQVAMMTNDILLTPTLQLLALGTAFWMLMTIILYFFRLGTADHIEFISTLFQKALLALVVGSFLTSSGIQNAVSILVSTPISATLAYTSAIDETNTFYNKNLLTEQLIKKTPSFVYEKPEEEYCRNDYFISTDFGSTDVFSQKMQRDILCMVARINKQFVSPLIVGRIMWSYSRGNKIVWDENSDSQNLEDNEKSPQVKYVLPAVVLIFCFTAMMFLIPFYFLDAIIKIGVVVILLPLLMVSYVFKSTREYAQIGWNIFLSSLVLFISFATMIPVILSLFETFISPYIFDIVSSISTEQSDNGEKLTSFLMGMGQKALGDLQFLMMTMGWFFISWKILKTTENLGKLIVKGDEAKNSADILIGSGLKTGKMANSGVRKIRKNN
ncbi:MAG: hypothetical protein PHI50_01605 [Alphaproteobacteria bacterium]|nr:hypothetical protein [Alphaproteobacteria bacterium]